ncbi:hypothetical protein AC578_8002 [Pseudocercospora eumusae]|uniref:Yeast cell wall synthesis Kre9/Knh1-like N-terminal domain-containing protein n=1 Tax=Pseudocercospora eumusae TaxID=321146 RepID=A0A139GU18_9PEZI|nr:hypothetical protein AC578_8002 [Pseudocercospora eumusae]
MLSHDRPWEINARVRWSRAGIRSVEGLASLEDSLAVGLQASFVAFFTSSHLIQQLLRHQTCHSLLTALPRSKQYRESNSFESQYIALIGSIIMFFKSLLVSALAALATAQSNPLGFTKVPNPVTVGKPNVITYMTNDNDTPVTILLRRGDSNNLHTVKTLTTSATDGSYIWTPGNDLDNGSDYALEIQQSGNQPNYFGPFQIQGSTESGSSSSSSGTAGGYGSMTHSSMSSTITATANISGTSTTLTATYPVSAGNMTSMSRNTTMTHATLTRSSSTASQTASQTTNGAGFQGTSTGASPSKTGNSASSFAAGGSAIALVFGAVAAIVMG